MASFGNFQYSPSWIERIQSWNASDSSPVQNAGDEKTGWIERKPSWNTGGWSAQPNTGDTWETAPAQTPLQAVNPSWNTGGWSAEPNAGDTWEPAPVQTPLQAVMLANARLRQNLELSGIQHAASKPATPSHPPDFQRLQAVREDQHRMSKEAKQEWLERKRKEEEEAQSQPAPPCVESVRMFLEKATKKQPTTFQVPMTISDLQRLMRALGERFRMDELDAMAKELGYDGPSDVIRRHCADLVKLETQDDKKAWQEQVTAIEEAGVDVEENKRTANEERFYARLPADELSYVETMLKKFLFRWMARRREENPEVPLLMDDALEDNHVKELMDGLSMKRYGVTLLSWLERRVQKDYDIAVGLDTDDRLVFISSDAGQLYARYLEESSTRSARINESLKVEGFEKGDGFMSGLPEQLSSAEIRFAKKLQRFDGTPLSWVQERAKEDIFQFIRELYEKRKLNAPKSARRFPFQRWIEERIGEYIVLESPNGSTDDPVLRRAGRGKLKTGNQPDPVENDGRGKKRLLPYFQSRQLRTAAQAGKEDDHES